MVRRLATWQYSGVDPRLEGTTYAPSATDEENEADELGKGFNHH